MKKNKILVIEDTESLLEETLDILKFEGFEPIGASNGKEGLEKAKKYNPDLIICDIMMPEMDGYQVLKSIRKDDRINEVPFLFHTALTSREELRKGMDIGADDYLTKPYSISELLSAISIRFKRQALSRKKADKAMSNLKMQMLDEHSFNIKSIHEKLEGTRKDLETCFYRLSHDLRAPISTILGLVAVSKLEDNCAESKLLFDKIQDRSRHMDDILNDLKKAAEIFEHTIKSSDLNLKKFLKNIEVEWYKSGLLDNRNLIINLEKGRSVFKTDERLFHIIITNLAEYVLHSSSQVESTYTLSIDFSFSDKYLNIEFKNSFSVILEEMEDRLFDLFANNSNKESSTKLELYIVKKAVEALNGKVEFKSKKDNGWSISLKIPDLDLMKLV